MEESFHSIKDVMLDDAPKFLIKEGRYTIRAWSFVTTKQEDSILNLSICDRTLQAKFHMLRQFGDGQGCQLILKVLQVVGACGLKMVLKMIHQDAFNIFRILLNDM